MAWEVTDLPGNWDPALSEFFEVIVALGLTLLMGIERQEKSTVEKSYFVGGVRTFPLIGLFGYGLAQVCTDSWLPAVGLLALGGLMAVSFLHKLTLKEAGITTEIAALIAYLVGLLIARDHLWIAVAAAISTVLLLQSKAPLWKISERMPHGEIATFAQFLILAVVILPVLPNRGYTDFELNPFKTWLIVVAVSGISYGSWLLQRVLKASHSVLLTAAIGGTYSSTATTIALAKRTVTTGQTWLHAGGIILASSVMYIRIAVLLWIFNPELGGMLGLRLISLGVAGAIGALAVANLVEKLDESNSLNEQPVTGNPLELQTAFIFAALFTVIQVATQLAERYLGDTGVYGLAGITGVTDVDPFILSLTQTAGLSTTYGVAVLAILIATGSNNLMKGIYAWSFGGRKVGVLSLGALLALALVSLLIAPH